MAIEYRIVFGNCDSRILINKHCLHTQFQNFNLPRDSHFKSLNGMPMFPQLFLGTFLILIFCSCSRKTHLIPKNEDNPSTKSTLEVNTRSERSSADQTFTNELELTPIDSNYLSKGYIEKDSSVWVPQSSRRDYRIFGYQEPSQASKKLFLISIFTSEVENNPFGCKYGSYYDSGAMIDEVGIRLKYIAKTPEFWQIALLKEGKIIDYSYVEDMWLEFMDFE